MTTAVATETVTQVFRVYINAKPQAIWDAITQPGWAEKYGYACRSEYELRAGGKYRVFANAAMKQHASAPDVIIVGEVIEADPPRKLVQTWHPIWAPEESLEPATRLTFEIEEEMGVSRLTVTHDVTGAPVVARMVAGNVPNAGGGWPFVLSDLKTLLETGKSLGEQG